jgi:hypothetical protein
VAWSGDPDPVLTRFYDDGPIGAPPIAARQADDAAPQRPRWLDRPRPRRRQSRRGRRKLRLKWPHPGRRFGDFLVFLTSADGALIGSRHERHRYVTVGLLMLVTAAQAFYAATLFFSVSLAKPFRSEVVFGVFFAVAVLLIDRSIVSYAAPIKLDKDRDLRPPKKANWVLAIRVVIALAAALLMSEMILLQVFAGDIKLQIQNDHLIATKTTNSQIEAYYQGRITPLQHQIATAKGIVDAQTTTVGSDYAAMNCQEFGCPGIGAGEGQGFDAAKAKYENALVQLGDDQRQFNTVSKNNGAAITTIEGEEQQAIIAAQPAITNANKVLSQEEAFWQLTVKNGTVLIVRLLLSLLILGIDLAPILFKLTGRTSVHDVRAHSGDYRLLQQEKHATGLATHQYAGQRATDRQLHDLAMDTAVLEGQQRADVARNGTKRWADVERGAADADANVSLYSIGVDAALKKLWEQHRYTTGKPPPTPGLPDDGSGGDWSSNGNGHRRGRRADHDVVVSLHQLGAYRASGDAPLQAPVPTPVQTPSAELIPDVQVPEPPSEVPPVSHPDLVRGPDDPFGLGDGHGIRNVAGILLGEDEERGSLVLDHRYVLKAQLPGVEPGGGGTVWQARDLLDPTRRRLVVKTVQLGTVHLGQLKALVREQRVAGAGSEHIGEILDHGQDRGFSYLVYPRYKPGSLALRIKWDNGSRPLPWCATVIYEVLSGLMEASAMELMHLDIKPGNIVLDEERVRVIDWGLSRKWDASQPSSWFVRGTPFYACPEQLFPPQAGWETPRADLFGVGATFYCLLTGAAPLQREARQLRAATDLYGYRQMLIDGYRPPPAHELVPQVPEPLSRLIDDWLSMDPALRVPLETPAKDVPRVARDQLAALLPTLPEVNVGSVTTVGRRRPR